MGETATLELYPENQAAESALGQVLEAALRAGRNMPPNGQAKDLLLQVFSLQVKAVLPVVLGFPEQVRWRWEHLSSAGREGHTAEVQAVRDLFLAGVEVKLRLTEQAQQTAEMVVQLTGEMPPEAAKLPESAQELRRLQAEVFGRWHTREDLEDLLAASFPLSGAKLEALGRKHAAPPAWYCQEGKPF